MSQVVVDLGDRSYPITIEAGLLSQKPLLEGSVSSDFVCIVSSYSIYELYGRQVSQAFSDKQCMPILLDDGEQVKSLASLNDIIGQLIEAKMPRSTCIVALGGGVIGDLAGFAASTYMRGVPFIQIPTTLLSQVDSSVGGKTAVNHALGKNMIGTFYQPQAVLIDLDVLNTLPDRDFSAGLAEVIKYGLIADATFFEFIEANIHRILAREPQALTHIIERSCQIKAQIVSEDERESGRRATLNFGHTMGHAIELIAGYGAFLHGEAVAIGMVYALDKSIEQYALDREIKSRLVQLLRTAALPTEIPATMDHQKLQEAILGDKKNTHGKVRWVLLDALGSAVVT